MPKDQKKNKYSIILFLGLQLSFKAHGQGLVEAVQRVVSRKLNRMAGSMFLGARRDRQNHSDNARGCYYEEFQIFVRISVINWGLIHSAWLLFNTLFVRYPISLKRVSVYIHIDVVQVT